MGLEILNLSRVYEGWVGGEEMEVKEPDRYIERICRPIMEEIWPGHKSSWDTICKVGGRAGEGKNE